MENNTVYPVDDGDALMVPGSLTARRLALLARLAIERAELLEQLLGLEEKALTEVSVVGDWTIKDVLAHIAAWDRWQHQAMRVLAEGRAPDLSAEEDYHAANDEFVARWHDRSLPEVLAELQTARGEWLTWLAGLPEEEFFRSRSYGGSDWSFYGGQIEVMWEHDSEHAQEIAAWRAAGGPAGKTSPKAVLLAALDGARQELLACVALLPVAERDSRPVCGPWTLKDVLGHLADWEQVGVAGLRDMAAGRAPQIEKIEDIEAWNQLHVEARRRQMWQQVLDDLYAIRQEFLEILAGMGQADLDCTYRFPWGPDGTVHEWISIFPGHDREHARDLWPGERG